MQIIHGNIKNEILNIISKIAKFQKVLLIYDTSAKPSDIKEISSCIKETCVYNQMSANNINKAELLNGYKTIIYLCKSSTLNYINIPKEEFTNVYCPTNNEILPCYLQKSMLQNNNDFIILNKPCLDFSALSSINFSKFYAYFNNLYSLTNTENSLPYFNPLISEQTIFNDIDSIPQNTFFIDIDIITKKNIPYQLTPFVNLILIDAFITFFAACKEKSLCLVDVYKATKNNDYLINKFYNLLCNNGIIDIINFNYSYLNNVALKVKDSILEIVNSMPKISDHEINTIINKIKDYSKENETYLTYLYLYNIFNC